MPKKKAKKAAKPSAKKAKASPASARPALDDPDSGGPGWGDFRDRLAEWIPERRHAQWPQGDEEPSKPWVREAYLSIKNLYEAVERLERIVHLGDPGLPYGSPSAKKEQGEPVIVRKPGSQGGKNPPPPPPCFP